MSATPQAITLYCIVIASDRRERGNPVVPETLAFLDCFAGLRPPRKDAKLRFS